MREVYEYIKPMRQRGVKVSRNVMVSLGVHESRDVTVSRGVMFFYLFICYLHRPVGVIERGTETVI